MSTGIYVINTETKAKKNLRMKLRSFWSLIRSQSTSKRYKVNGITLDIMYKEIKTSQEIS